MKVLEHMKFNAHNCNELLISIKILKIKISLIKGETSQFLILIFQ